jgi:hypothetical protein
MVISTDENGKPTVVAGDGDGDLTYLVDLMYPVGSYFMTTYGATNPGKLLGGQWDIVAENVVMPLGSTAPVKGTGMTLGLTNGTYNGGLIVNGSEVMKCRLNNYGQPVGQGTDNKNNMYNSLGVTLDETKSGMVVNLASSTNAIPGVDVYRRSL